MSRKSQTRRYTNDAVSAPRYMTEQLDSQIRRFRAAGPEAVAQEAKLLIEMVKMAELVAREAEKVLERLRAA